MRFNQLYYCDLLLHIWRGHRLLGLGYDCSGEMSLAYYKQLVLEEMQAKELILGSLMEQLP